MGRLSNVKFKLDTHKKSNVKLQNKRMTGRPLQKRRELVWLNSNGICAICEKIVLYEDYELDHKIPLFLGGEDVIENCQCLCKDCHLEKSKSER
jgi:5-methylcytosine-specific restriction endonuclease McrA